jgi:hypothetical protein
MMVIGERGGGVGWKLGLDWALADVAVPSTSSPKKAARALSRYQVT